MKIASKVDLLKGKTVRFRRGPAAVTGDESPLMPLSDFSGGKARLEDDPGARRPAIVANRANDFVE